ncbi:triose-phosphate isomerase [Streptococcus chenjunshii]|uniref:Triose-phosphate isomerase n=1 Tax=Streptococcus chenjunshii TaxID=2173853 RepID=A0A372KLE9_9STRE|nr:triose-phosphate isomerase [Streptococcus chenjunshii]AXQ79632.1 triose-phosphate isomerase [Streptococcus chenjunshii]RFU51053.1 triose-phosphate isomerase [Streptococcus chenjunshii]RFU53097.1 triose-phosphate isomerase [Streptococcus chenjunshii]
MTQKVRSPFFTVSPKAYLYGEELLNLAKLVDKIVKDSSATFFFVAPAIDLPTIVKNTKNLIVTAQTADGFGPGRGMGRTLLESLKYYGVGATFMNHMECPMEFRELVLSVKRAKELGIITIVCADTEKEAEILAHMHPDIILCEPYNLISTGQTSDESYIAKTIDAIKKVDEDILIMEGAGITCGDDVRRLISLGVDGTGISSVLTKNEDRESLLKEIFSGLE